MTKWLLLVMALAGCVRNVQPSTAAQGGCWHSGGSTYCDGGR